MINQPTLVLVHGFWGGAAHWSKVIVELTRRGYGAIRAVDLALTSLADDVERTRKMKAPLASTFGDAVTNPAWKTKPSWYQISSEDRMITPQNQERMAARLGARKVMTLNSSHASPGSVRNVSALGDAALKTGSEYSLTTR